MYTCPGSIDLERGGVYWTFEDRDEGLGLRQGATARDIDFRFAHPATAGIRAFIRTTKFEYEIFRTSTLGSPFVVAGTVPIDTPLSDVIEAVLNMLMIGAGGED